MPCGYGGNECLVNRGRDELSDHYGPPTSTMNMHLALRFQQIHDSDLQRREGSTKRYVQSREKKTWVPEKYIKKTNTRGCGCCGRNDDSDYEKEEMRAVQMCCRTIVRS